MLKKIYASNHASKREELKKEALLDIINCLEDGYSGYYCDLHNEVFNTNYYVTGRQEAVDILEEYGVFDAIEEVTEYEEDNFGEVYTEIDNPVECANMLYYIIGEEVIAEIYDLLDEYWNDDATDESNEEVIEGIRERYDLS